eukprot:INCI19305.1.p1 GENE.INCI19305.1~~INCI19305.1.p1  ORF type:complete len:528 (+),score=49.02 INCI19305.1:191-1774(+)
MLVGRRRTPTTGTTWCLVSTVAANFLLARAGNPLLPANTSLPDPHIHIFDGVAYLYSGRDLSKTAPGFEMPDWHVWSSKDLVSWTHERTIFPNQTFMGEGNDCYAVDVGRRNNLYAFFFSNRSNSFGVMTATEPTLGDAVDVLRRPLVSTVARPTNPTGVHVTNLTIAAYDPTVLIDDDANETAYICFGLHEKDASPYLIAKLHENFTVLQEEPRPIEFLPLPQDPSQEMPSGDKSTLHKRGDTYYLSAGSFYATATNPYGPYTFRGTSNPHWGVSRSRSFGDTAQAHGRFFEWNGQWFHVWCEFVAQNNTGTTPPGQTSYPRWRDSWMTYSHYRDDGSLVDDWNFLDQHGPMGVGQYNATWDRVEAEWYMEAEGSGVLKVDTTPPSAPSNNYSFGVQFDGGCNSSQPCGKLRFPHVREVPAQGILTVATISASLNLRRKKSTCAGGNIIVTNTRGSELASCAVALGGGLAHCPFNYSDASADEVLELSFLPTSSLYHSKTDSADLCTIVLDWWSLNSVVTNADTPF